MSVDTFARFGGGRMVGRVTLILAIAFTGEPGSSGGGGAMSLALAGSAAGLADFEAAAAT
jgi:hypothetical protein